jgi:hypothetical protein
VWCVVLCCSGGNGAARLHVPCDRAQAISAAAVLCATMGGHIFALDRSTGHPIWVFSAGTHAVVTSSPSLSPDGSTLYVAVQGANQQFSGYLLALSATGGGKVLWKVKVGSVDGSSPAVASAAGDGTIYIGSLDSHLHVTSQPDARYACLSCSCSRSPSLWPKHALNASTFGQEHSRVHAEYVHMLQCLLVLALAVALAKTRT